MYSSYRQPIMAFWAFALLAISMLWGASAYAVTPAGTVIKNLATVTYEDSLGNSYTAQSNESSVIVAEVFDAKLEKNNQTKEGAPGQTVYFPHQLINNGNTEDSFTLAATSSDSLNELKVYLDTNGNGQPDANEPVITDLKVAAGTTANLVVSAQVPGSADAGDELNVVLSANTDNSSFDGARGATNTDTIIVSIGPVLVARKQLIEHIPAELNTDGTQKADTGLVTYRIEITNNGSSLAVGGIYDFLPSLLDLASIEDPSGEDERLSGFVVNKEKPASIPSSNIPYTHHEKAMYMDLKNLGSGATVAFEFTAAYSAKKGEAFNFDANEALQNKAFVTFGDKVTETNLVTTTLPQFYGVDAGTDVTLPAVSAGGIAEFANTITNLGNGADTFNLALGEDTFPTGTVFSLWDSTGKIPLSDTNGDGIADTGVLLNKGSSIQVTVKAKLPAGEKATASSVKLIATSAGDANVTDFVTDTLTSITGESIDLANFKVDPQDSNVGIDFPSDSVITLAELFGADDAHPESAGAISTISLKPGNVAKFGLYIANESATASSFSLSSAIATNPAWKVTYIHNGVFDHDGTTEGKQLVPATNQPITSTPSLPGGSFMKVIAQVEIPADMSKVVAGDYNITFTIDSNIHGLKNSTINKITILEDLMLEFGPGGANQVEAGGITFYEHVLKNLSNTQVTVSLPAVTPDAGWNYLIYTRDEEGNLSSQPVAPSFEMESGAVQSISVKVMSPANAPAGYVFNLTLSALGRSTTGAETPPVFLTNSTTVVKGQVVLTKEVSKDGTIFTTSLTDVKPGETIFWRVTATVQGSAKAKNVIVTDGAPPFTTLAAPKDNTGQAGNPTISDGNGEAVVSGNGKDITFYIGEGHNATDQKGGSLNPGESVEVTFEVTLDK